MWRQKDKTVSLSSLLELGLFHATSPCSCCSPRSKDTQDDFLEQEEVQQLLLPVYNSWTESFWAPILLVLSNSGLLYSTYWCVQHGLAHEAFAYFFLAVASMIMHSYRDGRSWNRPKRASTRLVVALMRLDYMAVFHVSAASGIYLSQFDQSVLILSRPFFYVVSLTLAALLAFTGPHERVHLYGIVFLLFGCATSVPCLIMQPDLYNLSILAIVLSLQFIAYACIGYLQYHMPYWMGHTMWHLLGCTATFLVLLVRLEPPPASLFAS